MSSSLDGYFDLNYLSLIFVVWEVREHERSTEIISNKIKFVKTKKKESFAREFEMDLKALMVEVVISLSRYI